MKRTRSPRTYIANFAKMDSLLAVILEKRAIHRLYRPSLIGDGHLSEVFNLAEKATPVLRNRATRTSSSSFVTEQSRHPPVVRACG